ncbi:MAG TPA: FKBP-type peptidyl-prolyl cis-trans isomerase [Mycobacteriales bacterium]|nr:FKBP-type peptidyl-prolyl cis-trans isomerase [Mycobacteriales bacterium]
MLVAATAGCSSSSGGTAKVSTGSSPTQTAKPTGPPCKPIATNPPEADVPFVPPVPYAVTSLGVKDIKIGTGPAATAGSTVEVRYVGVGCSTGKVFDTNFTAGGQDFPVTPLGQAPVIDGWNQGLIGIHQGGTRELVIPPSLGYGAQGSPPVIGPHETLIFVVQADKVTP